MKLNERVIILFKLAYILNTGSALKLKIKRLISRPFQSITSLKSKLISQLNLRKHRFLFHQIWVLKNTVLCVTQTMSPLIYIRKFLDGFHGSVSWVSTIWYHNHLTTLHSGRKLCPQKHRSLCDSNDVPTYI